MKKIFNYFMTRKGVLNAFILIGGMTAMMSRLGFCFFCYHQPKFPDALRESNDGTDSQ